MIATFMALGFFIAALMLARENHGYMINYQHVSREQFFARARGLVICLSILAAYMATIALALRNRLSWSRALALAYFPIFCLACIAMFLQVLETPHLVDFIGIIFFTLLATPAAYWYLYRKPNVVAYYQAIEESSAVAPP